MDVPLAIGVFDDQGSHHGTIAAVEVNANINELDVLKTESGLTVRSRAGLTEAPSREQFSNALRSAR